MERLHITTPILLFPKPTLNSAEYNENLLHMFIIKK